MFSLYLILAVFIGLLQAKSSTGDSVLVILDNKLNQSDYSLFFGGLEGTCKREPVFRLFNILSQSKGIALPFARPETAPRRSRSTTHQTSTTLSSSHRTQKVRCVVAPSAKAEFDQPERLRFRIRYHTSIFSLTAR